MTAVQLSRRATVSVPAMASIWMNISNSSSVTGRVVPSSSSISLFTSAEIRSSVGWRRRSSMISGSISNITVPTEPSLRRSAGMPSSDTLNPVSPRS